MSRIKDSVWEQIEDGEDIAGVEEISKEPEE